MVGLAGWLCVCVSDAPLLKEPEPSLWQPGSCALMAMAAADCWLSGDGSGMSRADRREVWTFCNTFMRINRMLVDYKVRRAVAVAGGGRAGRHVYGWCAHRPITARAGSTRRGTCCCMKSTTRARRASATASGAGRG
jgi:hypothetical protein